MQNPNKEPKPLWSDVERAGGAHKTGTKVRILERGSMSKLSIRRLKSPLHDSNEVNLETIAMGEITLKKLWNGGPQSVKDASSDP